MKTCTKCGAEKPLSEFYKSPKGTGVRARCKFCIDEYNKAHWKPWYRKTPRKRERHVKQRLTASRIYLAAAEKQGMVCAICGNLEVRKNSNGTIKRLSSDHDHKTGLKRELLCFNCNVGLGFFLDNPLNLRAAARYIEKWKKM